MKKDRNQGRFAMRVLLFVLAVLLVGGFAAQNWPEITRSSDLLFGPVVMTAPLGLILLSALGVVLVVALLSSMATRTRWLMESRHHYKSLEAQRDLADKAEASRFTDLRQYLERSHGDLRAEMAQMNRAMMTRLAELDARIDARARTGTWGPTVPAPTLREERAEHAMADAQLERARAEAVREEARAEDRERRPGLFRNWR
jgi:uncharacterized integral membrane protein